jgi:hypothetical protein
MLPTRLLGPDRVDVLMTVTESMTNDRTDRSSRQ